MSSRLTRAERAAPAVQVKLWSVLDNKPTQLACEDLQVGDARFLFIFHLLIFHPRRGG